MFLRVVCALVSLLIVVMAFTQLIIPILRDTPVFPMFRGKSKRERLEAELAKIAEFEHELKLQKEIADRFAETMAPASVSNPKSIEREPEQ
jgi:hypothetical protein